MLLLLKVRRKERGVDLLVAVVAVVVVALHHLV
jgi:hypothetical protein